MDPLDHFDDFGDGCRNPAHHDGVLPDLEAGLAGRHDPPAPGDADRAAAVDARRASGAAGDAVWGHRPVSGEQGPAFVSGEGLRALLQRLHRAGAQAWTHDREAEAVMHYATAKYGALARAYGLEPEDAAHAAYLAMRASSTRTAKDPWAVVTTAVRISVIAEARAQALMISPDRARRRYTYGWHDVQRFGERTDDIDDYHPALATSGGLPSDDDPFVFEESSAEWQMRRATEGTIMVLVARGWPPAAARIAVEYVCNRLMRAGSRPRAYEQLRRDRTARAMCDMSHQDWIGVLRVILGHPSSPRVLDRYGVLTRLVLGDELTDLVHDTTSDSVRDPHGTHLDRWPDDRLSDHQAHRDGCGDDHES